MGEVVDPSQDLCSPYHVSSSDNLSLNRVYSLITQRSMAWVVDMEENILPKFAVIVERQGIPLIHAIKSMESEVESQQIGFTP